jgi:hypothetical protein
MIDETKWQKFNEDREAESVNVEKETGFERTRKSVDCSGCGRALPVFIWSITSAEAGFIKYDPPRIYEQASLCPVCQGRPWTDYEFVHQEGGKSVER